MTIVYRFLLLNFKLTICAYFYAKNRFLGTNKKPILVHYLAQRVLQMDKFWENSGSNSTRSMHFSTFLTYRTMLISINRTSGAFQTYGTFVELNGSAAYID